MATALVRSGLGHDYITTAVQQWLDSVVVKTLHIKPGILWESAYCDSFFGLLHDKLLNGNILWAQADAAIQVKSLAAIPQRYLAVRLAGQ